MNPQEKNTQIKISYTASVFTAAGWRPVTIFANACKISTGMAIVELVTEIDSELPTGYTSRTGSQRQTYHAAGVAKREIGKKKRLSACVLVGEQI